jgi:hypothetical protein
MQRTSLLGVALDYVARGWHVFPCVPRNKKPLVPGGFHAAANDETQIRAWWAKWPDANVGIATGASGLCVLDIDHGLRGVDQLARLMDVAQIPATYAVRTGRRPEFGAQLYFAGSDLRSIPWKFDSYSGDIRCATGYVMAAGSVHPSGELYEQLPGPAIPVEIPAFVRNLKADRPELKDDEPITVARNNALTSIAGRLRNMGLSADALELVLLQQNADRCSPPLPEEEVKRIAANASKWELPRSPEIVLGRKPDRGAYPGIRGEQDDAIPRDSEGVVDWRSRYMTEEQYRNVTPPKFLIDGFLVKGSIAMLGGPVAQRKSIIAANVAHALCTGEPLFDYFEVSERPRRVVYLCPEMGAASFVKRIKAIGLGDHVAKTLFVQTMNERPAALDELRDELPGAVVIVDTITRFLDGDESKSDDMRKFAAKVFRLVNAGATVVLLHHSKKGSSGNLDDGLRGSSELAAFVDSCWITELEDTKQPYISLSKMRNVKQRDFESDPFRLKPTPGGYRLKMADAPAPEVVVASKKEAAAREALAAILKAHPSAGINKVREALKAKGHGKGNKWVAATMSEMRGNGVVLSSEEPIPHPHPL